MISAVILTKNNRESIGRTLDSLAWCTERIIIDDYSSDTTVSAVKRYNVKIYKRHLEGDFAAQRNFGLRIAKSKWVLFIDSDEVVSGKLRKEIQKVIVNDSISGYFLKRQDRMFGTILTHGETGRVRLLRLARKSAGTWHRPVHETWDVKGTTSELTNPLFHYPHPNVAQFLDDINRYSTINAEYLFANRVRSSLFQIVMYPTAKFFVNYIWFGGFLDGTAGIIVALMMSFHSFLTRAKLYTHRIKNV